MSSCHTISSFNLTDSLAVTSLVGTYFIYCLLYYVPLWEARLVFRTASLANVLCVTRIYLNETCNCTQMSFHILLCTSETQYSLITHTLKYWLATSIFSQQRWKVEVYKQKQKRLTLVVKITESSYTSLQSALPASLVSFSFEVETELFLCRGYR